MTFDLSNISQTTNRESEELSVQCTCNGFANRGFSDTRRTNQADDLAFDRPAELTNSKELKNTIFDVLEAVMVFIEDPLCMCDGIVLRRMLTPRNLKREMNTRLVQTKKKLT